MPADMETAVDVALWFADKALDRNEYLQPQKLHRLLFLAQGYYSVAYRGRKLMPAVFVADEMGPVEPNVFRVFARGRPDVEPNLFLPERVEVFLDSIWRRFGHHSAEALTRMAKDTMAYRRAFKRGPRAEISLDSIRLSFARADETPALGQVVRPKVLRTATGRPVTVKSWLPAAKPPRPR